MSSVETILNAGVSGPVTTSPTSQTFFAPSGGQTDVAQRLLPGKNDPWTLAADVAERMRAGTYSMIEACVLFVDGVRRFEADHELTENFLEALVRENVIPKRSARLGIEKSKLSMLRKIGLHADLLLDARIFKYLPPGRSILLYVIRLYEVLSGDHDSRIERLVQLFEAEGSPSRDFLIEQVKLAERASQPDAPQTADPWVAGDRGERFDLILMTVLDRHDPRRLLADYPDRKPFCLRVHERVANGAVGIVIARLVDLPVIENKLLPGCGFDGFAQGFLLRDPIDPDVTDAQVIVVTMRGRRGIEGLASFQWLPDGEPLDAVALASCLMPDAKTRLHLFASARFDGWSSTIGEANWSQADE